jgi:hypothetical protein
MITSCAGGVPLAKFPERSRIELAVRDPLVGPELQVQGEWVGPKGRLAGWLVMDSGSEAAIVDPKVVEAVGGTSLASDVGGTDSGGTVVRSTAVLLPELDLGGASIRDVVALAHPGHGLLGQPVLAHGPWQLDWDRGRLTLGATPWEPTSGDVQVPLVRHDGSTVEYVAVSVNGHPVEMILDTGAITSQISESTGDALGLPSEAVGHETGFRGVGGRVAVSRVFSASIRLGTWESPVRRITAAKSNLALLGLDVLSQFNLQVVPGKSLTLRPRAPLERFARERLSRWPWVPASCGAEGCARVRMQSSGGPLEIEVEPLVSFDRPVQIVFACERADAPLSRLRTVAERLEQDASREPATHLVVTLPPVDPGRTQHLTFPLVMPGLADPLHPCEWRIMDIAPASGAALRAMPM